MTVNHVARYKDVLSGFRELADAAPEVMSGFQKVHRTAMRAGALDASTKELMALAVGIASGCEHCVTYHVHDAMRAGATRDQIQETLGVAVFMGGGPAAVRALEAMDALAQFEMAGVEQK